MKILLTLLLLSSIAAAESGFTVKQGFLGGSGEDRARLRTIEKFLGIQWYSWVPSPDLKAGTRVKVLLERRSADGSFQSVQAYGFTHRNNYKSYRRVAIQPSEKSVKVSLDQKGPFGRHGDLLELPTRAIGEFRTEGVGAGVILEYRVEEETVFRVVWKKIGYSPPEESGPSPRRKPTANKPE